jgi:hypothetical protein
LFALYVLTGGPEFVILISAAIAAPLTAADIVYVPRVVSALKDDAIAIPVASVTAVVV